MRPLFSYVNRSFLIDLGQFPRQIFKTKQLLLSHHTRAVFIFPGVAVLTATLKFLSNVREYSCCYMEPALQDPPRFEIRSRVAGTVAWEYM